MKISHAFSRILTHSHVIIFSLLFLLPFSCKAEQTIKRNIGHTDEYVPEKPEIIPNKKFKNPFKEKIDSTYLKYFYENENLFHKNNLLTRAEEVPNAPSSSQENDKSYAHYRRMREEDVNVVDMYTRTITLGKGRAYYFKSKNSLTKGSIKDNFYQKGTKHKVSKEDWDNAFNKSDECTEEEPYKNYIVRIRFKDGKTIEYNVVKEHPSDDWTRFSQYEGYEYYYEHCFFNNSHKDEAYDVIEDYSGVWSCFKEIRRDYKEVVDIIKATGHYAEYHDTVGSSNCAWSANIQLKHDEIDFIEIRY